MSSSDLFLNKSLVRERIRGFSMRKKLLFALGCAERLYPNYVHFVEQYVWGEPTVLREALDALWSVVRGVPVGEERLRQLKSECFENAPDTAEFDGDVSVSHALSASLAIVATLDLALEKDSDKVIRVAAFCWDTVEMELNTRVLEDLTMDQMRVHPIVVPELTYEDGSLDFLSAHEQLDDTEIEEFRRLFCAGQTPVRTFDA